MKVVVTGGAGFIGANLCRAPVAERRGGRGGRASTTSRPGSARTSTASTRPSSRARSSTRTRSTRSSTAPLRSSTWPPDRRSRARSPTLSPPTRRTRPARSTCSRPLVGRAARMSWSPRRRRCTAPTRSCPSTRTWSTRPMSPYAASKLATESYALGMAAHLRRCRPSRSASSTCSVRCRPPATPTRRSSRPSSRPRSSGEPLQVHGDGTQSRDFTYVDTVCAVHRRRGATAGRQPRAGQPGLRHPHDPARGDRAARGAARSAASAVEHTAAASGRRAPLPGRQRSPPGPVPRHRARRPRAPGCGRRWSGSVASRER